MIAVVAFYIYNPEPVQRKLLKIYDRTNYNFITPIILGNLGTCHFHL